MNRSYEAKFESYQHWIGRKKHTLLEFFLLNFGYKYTYTDYYCRNKFIFFSLFGAEHLIPVQKEMKESFESLFKFDPDPITFARVLLGLTREKKLVYSGPELPEVVDFKDLAVEELHALYKAFSGMIINPKGVCEFLLKKNANVLIPEFRYIFGVSNSYEPITNEELKKEKGSKIAIPLVDAVLLSFNIKPDPNWYCNYLHVINDEERYSVAKQAFHYFSHEKPIMFVEDDSRIEPEKLHFVKNDIVFKEYWAWFGNKFGTNPDESEPAFKTVGVYYTIIGALIIEHYEIDLYNLDMKDLVSKVEITIHEAGLKLKPETIKKHVSNVLEYYRNKV